MTMPCWLCDCGVLLVIAVLTVAVLLDCCDERRRKRAAHPR